MRTKEEIIRKKEWVLKALDEEENQGEIRQIQLYAQLDLLKWLECGTSDEQETIENLLNVQYALADNLNKQTTCLEKIKTIVEELLEKGLEPQSVEHQLRLRGKRELASIILDLITKAEEE